MNKKYGIFKIKDGQILGYIERSFSMDWVSDAVRLWDKESILKYYVKDFAKQIANKEVFIIRITNTYPKVFQNKLGIKVKIDWKHRKDLLSNSSTNVKFNRRNVPFYILESNENK